MSAGLRRGSWVRDTVAAGGYCSRFHRVRPMKKCLGLWATVVLAGVAGGWYLAERGGGTGMTPLLLMECFLIVLVGAALLRRMLSNSFIRGYTHGRPVVGVLWPGTASGQRLHSLLSGSRSV